MFNSNKAPLVLVWVMISVSGVSHAATLEDALVRAYQTNPGLQVQREKLRAIDEGYVQAKAEFAPTVSLQVQTDYERERLGLEGRHNAQLSSTPIPDYYEQNSVSGQLVFSQPLYSSGRFAADVKAADANVRAGRAALRTAEANLLFSVIQAYVGLQRDEDALQIRTANLAMLKHQVDETVARQRAGEVTRTDVSQAEAQLASEQALYAAAQGQIDISRASYLALVGGSDDTVAPPPDLIGLPTTLDAAMTAAERDNPDLQQAVFNEQSSKAKVYAARANGKMVVSAQLRAGYDGSLVPYDGRDLNHDLSLTTNVVIPLYSGGMQTSQVKQALDENSADQFNIDDVHRHVIQNVSIAWRQMLIAQAGLEAQERQVAAAKIAFEGMRKEYSNGDRSTLDVLVAEETLRDAELSVASSRHDLYLSKALILQNMGWLELENLVSTPIIYDPTRNLAKRSTATEGVADALRHLDNTALPDIHPIRLTH
jgi:outer membrane protein